MSFSYIARQPILDEQRRTFAYELLFRDGPQNSFPDVDPEQATSRLLSDNLLSNSDDLLDNKWAFVNFPQASIINLIPTLFDKTEIVIEILEDCEPNDELFIAIKKLYRLGYKLALDDFIPSRKWLRFLPYIHYIKFDIRAISIQKSEKFIKKLDKTSIKFLAEKVETHQEFQLAKRAGFELFQGYFFSQPEVMKRKAIEPSVLAVVQLLTAISARNIDFKYVESIVTQDVSLSYKLLQFVNSSAMVSAKIRSFGQALVYLGEARLRRFVSLVAVANTNADKPDSLYVLAIQRARFCELIAEQSKIDIETGEAFIVGMFSLLDSLLDQPLEQLLKDVAVEVKIKNALLTHDGVLGKLLDFSIAYEQADWSKVQLLQDTFKISDDKLLQCYQGGLQWAHEVTLQSDTK